MSLSHARDIDHYVYRVYDDRGNWYGEEQVTLVTARAELKAMRDHKADRTLWLKRYAVGTLEDVDD